MIERTADQGIEARQGIVKVASRTLWAWVEQHHIDSLAVIGVTLWLTVRVIEWAMEYADLHYDIAGLQVAAIIGAVLTPWGIMQAALFKFYVDLKAKSNGAVKP